MLPAVLGPPVQIAYVVPDLDAAIAWWSATSGAGPFFVNEHIPLQKVRVFGRDGVFDHSSAYGQWGEVMLELVQDHTPGPSPITALGLHHLAFFVDGLDVFSTGLSAAGYPEALFARTMSGTSFVFHDASLMLGHMLELYERTERLTTFYSKVAAASVDWNGENPRRSIGDLR